MARKRSKRLAYAKWRPTKLEFSPTEWEAIQTALNMSLLQPQREAISQIVQRFLTLEGAERAAPFEKERLAYLDKLSRAAEQMKRIFSDRGGNRALTAAISDVQVELDKIAKAAGFSSPSLEIIAEYLPIAICAARTDDDAGWNERDCWEEMILNLLELLQSWGVSTSIRKDEAIQKGEIKISKIVQIVHAIQAAKCFPDDAKRHQFSLQGLWNGD